MGSGGARRCGRGEWRQKRMSMEEEKRMTNERCEENVEEQALIPLARGKVLHVG